MEEIIKDLKEIVEEQMKHCKENKIAPSNEILNAIELLDKFI